MNEQLQNALVQIIEKTQAGVDASVSFLSQEMPDVIRQLLMYKTAEYSVTIVLGLLFFITGLFILFKANRDFKESSRTLQACWIHDGDSYAALTGLGGVALIYSTASAIVSLIVIIDSVFALAKITIAPKIWLIEYAASLAK